MRADGHLGVQNVFTAKRGDCISYQNFGSGGLKGSRAGTFSRISQEADLPHGYEMRKKSDGQVRDVDAQVRKNADTK